MSARSVGPRLLAVINAGSDLATQHGGWVPVMPHRYGVVEVLGLRVKEQTLDELVDDGLLEVRGAYGVQVRITSAGRTAVTS